uniref:Uncharacterized protein n=1 Tax=Fagus sylvatica TaxID=28930 RepID=A0A2N9GY74_FAGSY
MSSTACIKWIKIGSPFFKPTLIVGLLLASSQVDCTNPCIASLIFLALDLVIGPIWNLQRIFKARPTLVPIMKQRERPNHLREKMRELATNPRRVMIMRDNGEVMTESEDDSDGMPELVDASDDDGVVYPVTGESLVARRAPNTHIKVDDAEQQRENTFHTRCHVNNKWLNDCGEVRVDRQVLVTFSIGKYLDEVLCDVVPMHAGHILLGRPWQYDRRVTHDGFKNMYSFVKGGKTIKLAPLTLSQVYEDQLKLKSRGNLGFETDGNQGGPSLKDPLQVPDGPITRSRAKKIKEVMQGLVQSTWDEASKSPTIKVGLKEGEPILIHLIQAAEDMT